MTFAPARRINARLPADVATKIAYLERRLDKSTTEVVLESIEHFYAAVVREQGAAAQRLAEAGFVGCAKGPADLSVTYKRDLEKSMKAKT